ncbi:probable glycerol-3-phosphate acyltransferase 3 [Phalaenopsis equestris]|uniref:probable glycerol-3-phosphate acyltransferase 3 n=1 Tax=Phalaenopsis equestris TaxID=78828 RepID=UPI0009E275D5|nr:probable glycerol-3-phosphate acyltransferase 3 [Phalaenopsis equestris]
MEKLRPETVVLEVEGGLLRSSSTFPYFMLVAIEGGGFLRGLILLLLYPVIHFMSNELGLRVMVIVCFLGVRKNGFRVGRTVLPKFMLEDMGLEEFEVVRKVKRKVGVTEMPRVMVESFLGDYLGVEVVVGRELKEFGGFYTGLMEDMEFKDLVFGKDVGGGGGVMGLCSSSKHNKHPVFSQCKEIYLVGEAEKRNKKQVPREKYPKPLIFHDGRLAIRPDPINSIAIFMWLPFGILLSVLRLAIAAGLLFYSTIPLAATGITWKVRGAAPSSSPRPQNSIGQLYICNHKTLLDPNVISLALNRKTASVSYGLSQFSAIISPIKINWLTRNLEEDRKRMEGILSRGEDLVVCAEGTTCREPYLLRFSPLFTELTDIVVPVAIDLHVSMFYATTVSGNKWMDPFYFLMNPHACYELEFLEKVDTSRVRAGDCSRFDMANHVQRQIGKALGFECTMLRRKDKYMMLA